MRRCPECGAKAPAGEMACAHCGAALPNKPSRGRIVLIILCFSVAILLTAGLVGRDVYRNYQLDQAVALGSQYLQAGNLEQAVLAFARAAEIDGENTSAKLGLAEGFIALGREREAEEILEEIITLNPAMAEPYTMLYRMCMNASDVEGAVAVLSKGAKAAGVQAFAALQSELEAKVSIKTVAQQGLSGQAIALQLLYSSDGTQVLLSPHWEKEGEGSLAINPDGSAEITMDAPGEVTVSAALGILNREVTLTFVPDAPKQAAELIRKLCYPFVIPAFSNPDELDNDILLIFLINWVQRTSGEYKEIVTMAESEEAALEIFGPDLKELTHETNWLAWWHPDTQEYEVIPMGIDGIAITYILEYRETESQYLVDVVHLNVFSAWDETEEEMVDVYDENDRLLGTYYYSELDEVFSSGTWTGMPKRRYVFTKLSEGGFYLIQSVQIQ